VGDGCRGRQWQTTDTSGVFRSVLGPTNAMDTYVSFAIVSVQTQTVYIHSRDDHGNGIPNGNGNPMGFPWEWELVTKLGMGMGRNGNRLHGNGREWECKKPFPGISNTYDG